jgi:hypothetical protein
MSDLDLIDFDFVSRSDFDLIENYFTTQSNHELSPIFGQQLSDLFVDNNYYNNSNNYNHQWFVNNGRNQSNAFDTNSLQTFNYNNNNNNINHIFSINNNNYNNSNDYNNNCVQNNANLKPNNDNYYYGSNNGIDFGLIYNQNSSQSKSLLLITNFFN